MGFGNKFLVQLHDLGKIQFLISPLHEKEISQNQKLLINIKFGNPIILILIEAGGDVEFFLLEVLN